MIAPGGQRSGSGVRITATVLALAVDHDVTVVLVIGVDRPDPDVVGRCRAWCGDHGVGLEVVQAPKASGIPLLRAVQLWIRSVLISVRANRPSMPSRLADVVAAADLLWVFHIYPYMAAAVPIHRCTVVDIDDLKEHLDPSGPGALAVGRRLHHSALGRLRRHVVRSVQAVAVSSSAELDVLRSVAPGANLAILANTAAAPSEPGEGRVGNPPADDDPAVAGDPMCPTPVGSRVVMVGNLSYRPNAEAALWFLRKVWPQVRAANPSATFALIGGGATPVVMAAAEQQGVEMVGEVADLTAELSAAALSVAPLLSGTGTRVKILEAFAWSLPVVSTSVGASGLDVVSGRDLILADDPVSFAEAVIGLLGDPDAAMRLGTNGRVVFDTRHNPGVFARQLRSLSESARAVSAGLDITHVVLTRRFAGIERHVTSLSAALASDGHRVRIVCVDPDVMSAGLATANCGSGVELVAAANWRSAAWRIALIRHSDIVHAHTTGSLVAAVLGLVGRSTPLVATGHFSWKRWSGDDGQGHRIGRLPWGNHRHLTSGQSRSGWFRARAEHWVDRRVTSQLAVSQVVAAGIGGTVEVIHPGVMAPIHRAPAVQRQNRVLVLQRLEPDKATEVALGAWLASGLRQKGWALDVVGGGSQFRELNDLARRLGIDDSVELHGHIDDVLPFLQQAALLLAPAPMEPYGLSVVEAMAHGLPVVASRSGGHLETLGLMAGAALFAPGDARGAGSLLDLLGPDPDARQRLADAQFELQQERFGLAGQVAAMESFYSRLAGQ